MSIGPPKSAGAYVGSGIGAIGVPTAEPGRVLAVEVGALCGDEDAVVVPGLEPELLQAPSPALATTASARTRYDGVLDTVPPPVGFPARGTGSPTGAEPPLSVCP